MMARFVIGLALYLAAGLVVFLLIYKTVLALLLTATVLT